MASATTKEEIQQSIDRIAYSHSVLGVSYTNLIKGITTSARNGLFQKVQANHPGFQPDYLSEVIPGTTLCTFHRRDGATLLALMTIALMLRSGEQNYNYIDDPFPASPEFTKVSLYRNLPCFHALKPYPSLRHAIEAELLSYQSFRKALSHEDEEVFDPDIGDYTRTSIISSISNPWQLVTKPMVLRLAVFETKALEGLKALDGIQVLHPVRGSPQAPLAAIEYAATFLP